MALATCIQHGDTDFEIGGTRRLKKSLTDLDSLSVERQSSKENSFVAGKPYPGLPGIIMTEIETEEDFAGLCYLHRIKGEGVAGKVAEKLIKRTTVENLEGLDEGTEEWITRSPEDHERGAAMPGQANLYCMSAEKEELRSAFWRVRKNFRGLIGTKPYSRRITCDENTVSPSDPIIVDLPGGWATANKGSVSLPNIVVEDTTIETAAPATNDIPGNLTPPDAPTILALTLSGDLVQHWPNGWKHTIAWKPIPGTTVGELTRRYVYQYFATF